jgi:inorganic pyrophosphatase
MTKQKRNSTEKNSSLNFQPIEVIVETPRGSRNKIKYEPSTKRFKLSKVMPEGMLFPYDFGFVPGTKADDGDPLDVLVLTDEALFPGCQVECRLIGVIEAEQTEKSHTNRNDRLIAVATQSILYSELKEIEDLNAKVLEQIGAFFVNYQKVRDIDVRIVRHSGSSKAYQLLAKASHDQAA